MWNRLPQSNSWLFYTQYDVITIYCENPVRTFTLEIYGIGRLTISVTCSIHTNEISLLPSNQIKPNTYADLIPENPEFSIKSTLSKMLSTLIPQNIFNVQVIKDLVEFSQNLQDVNTLKEKPAEPPFIKTVDIHIILIYIFEIFCLAIIIFVIFKIKEKIVKMYQPDLPEITEL